MNFVDYQAIGSPTRYVINPLCWSRCLSFSSPSSSSPVLDCFSPQGDSLSHSHSMGGGGEEEEGEERLSVSSPGGLASLIVDLNSFVFLFFSRFSLFIFLTYPSFHFPLEINKIVIAQRLEVEKIFER